MSVGLAMTRVLVDRHRRGLIAGGLYMTVFTILIAAFGEPKLPYFGAFLLFVGLLVCSFYLTAVFLHSDSDVAIPGSTYPAHYFTLPVPTRDLVFWPVLTGIVVLGGSTFLLCLTAQYGGYPISAVETTVFMIALLTVLQAIFWSPVGISYSKLLLTIFAIGGLIALSYTPTLLGISSLTKCGLFVAISAGAVAITALGVARARRGESWISVRPRLKEAEMRTRLLKMLPPFRGPAQAQFWYEWR